MKHFTSYDFSGVFSDIEDAFTRPEFAEAFRQVAEVDTFPPLKDVDGATDKDESNQICTSLGISHSPSQLTITRQQHCIHAIE